MLIRKCLIWTESNYILIGCCRISFDEGRQWTHHIFSAMPLFVDGVLVEPGMENQILTWVLKNLTCSFWHLSTHILSISRSLFHAHAYILLTNPDKNKDRSFLTPKVNYSWVDPFHPFTRWNLGCNRSKELNISKPSWFPFRYYFVYATGTLSITDCLIITFSICALVGFSDTSAIALSGSWSKSTTSPCLPSDALKETTKRGTCTIR